MTIPKIRKSLEPVRPLRAVKLSYPDIGDGVGECPVIPGSGRVWETDYTPTVNRSVVGWFQVIVGGKDVTWFRGVPTEIVEYGHVEPFGSSDAVLKFPQVTPFDDLADGKLSWLATGKNVTINLVNPAKQREKTVFEGFIVSFAKDVSDAPGGEFCITAECQGTLFQADYILAQPEIVYDETDIGYVIADLLNGVPARRYGRVKRVKTGITTRSRSAWEQILSGRVADLLATAITDDGENQWTVKMNPARQPKIVLKDYDTTDWTVYNGAAGIGFSLRRDMTSAPTTLYGRGVDKNGYGWANLKTPGYDPDNLETYPYINPATAVTASSSSTLREKVNTRLNELGYRNVPNGATWTDATTTAVRKWQKRNGETVTGTVTPQTWCSLFLQAGDTDALENAFYAPLATVDEVEEYDYRADGRRDGKNTNFDPQRLRVERFHAYPEGESKTRSKGYAEAELARDKNAGWHDTISLTSDPVEGSKFKILAGDNIRIKNWGGDVSSLLFHVSEVRAYPNENKVVLTVDVKGRDYLTLDAIRLRDYEARNPSRKPGKYRRNDLQDGKPIIDSEFIGRVAAVTEAEKWSVIRVPLGSEGTIVKTVFEQTEGYYSKFVVAFFNQKITPKELARINDPFAKTVDDKNPFPGDEDTAEWLEEKGLLDVLGGPGEACGFYPGLESEDDPLTGKHKDENVSLPFTALKPPYVYLAFYSENPAKFTGRVYVAPGDW